MCCGVTATTKKMWWLILLGLFVVWVLWKDEKRDQQLLSTRRERRDGMSARTSLVRIGGRECGGDRNGRDYSNYSNRNYYHQQQRDSMDDDMMMGGGGEGFRRIWQ